MKIEGWKAWIVSGAIVLVLGAGLASIVRPVLYIPDACLSDTVATTSLFGAKLEAVYTNCDTLAKDESVRVYVSSVAEGAKAAKNPSGEVIFDYDPSGNQTAPSIEDVGDHKLLISISEVSSIFVQKRRWHDISIDYRIGHVWYPSVPQGGR